MTIFSDLPKTGSQEQSKRPLYVGYSHRSIYHDVVEPLIGKLMRVRAFGKASSPFWPRILGQSLATKLGPSLSMSMCGAVREGGLKGVWGISI